MTTDSRCYEFLPSLPIALLRPQCVFLNTEEILICGGQYKNDCYSYHTIKKQYKLICSYPKHVRLYDHMVIKYDEKIYTTTTNESIGGDREITLLSFGGMYKHTLMMKYRSVWNETTKYRNRWTPAQHNIGNKQDDLTSVKAVIVGKERIGEEEEEEENVEEYDDDDDDNNDNNNNNNNQQSSKSLKNRPLIFIVYKPNHIDVLDWKTLKCIAKGTLPIVNMEIGNFCFAKIMDSMFLFHQEDGVCIQYNPDKKTFSYKEVAITPNLRNAHNYTYITIMGAIIFFGGFYFGGRSSNGRNRLNDVYIYSTIKKEWKQCHIKLPTPIYGSLAISENQYSTWIYIIGGHNGSDESKDVLRINRKKFIGLLLQELEAILNYWIRNNLSNKLGWIVDFNNIIAEYLESLY